MNFVPTSYLRLSSSLRMASSAPDPKPRTLRSSARSAAAKAVPSARAPAAAQKKTPAKPTAAKKRRNGKKIKSAEHVDSDSPIVESEDEPIPSVAGEQGGSSPLPDMTPSPQKVPVASPPIPSPRSAPPPPPITVLTPTHTSAPSTPRRCDGYVAPPDSPTLGVQSTAPHFPSSDPISPPDWFARKADRTHSMPDVASGSGDSMPNAPTRDETSFDDLQPNSSSAIKLRRAVIAEGGNPAQAKAAMSEELGRPVDVYPAPDALVREAGKVVTNTIEFELRGRGETPPLKRVVRGHAFYDKNTNLGWHYRNFPEMYDVFGQPLTPDCPWPENGLDIGSAPLELANYTRTKVPAHIADDIIVNHFRVLKDVEGQKVDPSDITIAQFLSMVDLSTEDRWIALQKIRQEQRDAAAAKAEETLHNQRAEAASGAAHRPQPQIKAVAHAASDVAPDDGPAADDDLFEDGEISEILDSDTDVDQRKGNKGKEKAIDLQEGPSNTKRGRPTITENARWTALGTKIKAQIEELATELDVNYATAVRKLGFSQQEVRHGHIANTHRMVNKHRLKESGGRKYLVFLPLQIHVYSSMHRSMVGKAIYRRLPAVERRTW